MLPDFESQQICRPNLLLDFELDSPIQFGLPYRLSLMQTIKFNSQIQYVWSGNGGKLVKTLYIE